MTPWERPRREGLVEGEKDCIGCGAVKPHTFDSATSGYYLYVRDGVVQGWDGRCIRCKNLDRARRWNAARGLDGHQPRTPRISREERNRRRRERHAHRMATDREYVRKQYDSRPRLNRVDRVGVEPFSILITRVLKDRCESQADFARAIEVKDTWLGDILTQNVKTVELCQVDRILTFLDLDTRLIDLYPELE